MLVLAAKVEYAGETNSFKSLDKFPKFCKLWKFSMAIKPMGLLESKSQSIVIVSDSDEKYTGTPGSPIMKLMLNNVNTGIGTADGLGTLKFFIGGFARIYSPEIVLKEWNTIEMEQYKLNFENIDFTSDL